jgi:hypothetical protein
MGKSFEQCIYVYIGGCFETDGRGKGFENANSVKVLHNDTLLD